MQDLGTFMKKRTRDLAIGATLVGVGMVGAMAFLVDKSQQKEVVIQSGTGQITSANGGRTISINENSAPSQNGRTYAQTQLEPNQSHQPPLHAGPAYQQGSFTHHSTPQHTPNSQGLCAPEALAVGIKHFKYDDVDPKDLVASGYGSDPKFQIHKSAKPALQEMIAAAKKDGVTLTPGSILRTSSRQAQIVANKKKQGQSAKQIYYTSSHPGYSEHHTGLAVDFSPINDSFAKTAGYRWLKNNAHKYGFYQTFTADYSAYSGVSEESWHWRFEGKNGEFAHLFEASKNRLC